MNIHSNSLPILHLNLHRHWFELIQQGIKIEEYRSIKPHWSKFFKNTPTGWFIRIRQQLYRPQEVLICFRNGYATDAPQCLVPCLGLSTGTPKPEWTDGKPDSVCYILQLGKSF